MGWFENVAGAFTLRTTENDNIEVAAASAGLTIYTRDGHLLNHVDDHNAYARISALPMTSGPYIVRGWLAPHVVDCRTGVTVIATGWVKPHLRPRSVVRLFRFGCCPTGNTSVATSSKAP